MAQDPWAELANHHILKTNLCKWMYMNQAPGCCNLTKFRMLSRSVEGHVQIATQPWNSLDELKSVTIFQSILPQMVVGRITEGDVICVGLNSFKKGLSHIDKINASAYGSISEVQTPKAEVWKWFPASFPSLSKARLYNTTRLSSDTPSWWNSKQNPFFSEEVWGKN